MTEGAPRWHSVHLHYHDRDRHDDVILDALRPALAELAPEVESAWFERHWLRGPHLRLHAKVPPDRWSAELGPQVEDRLRRYVATHPSTVEVDVEAALAEHRLLAELEGVRSPLAPWPPDNAVLPAAYDPRHHVVGGEAAAELLAGFHSDATGTVLTMLDAMRRGRGRADLCLELMFALAEVACPPVGRGAISYGSHAEHFLANCADPERVRATFEARYGRNRRALARRLERVLQTLDGRDAGAPLVPVWAELWRRYQRRGEELLAAGRMDLELPEAARPRDLRTSSFQEALEDDDVWPEISGALWFRSYRLLLNLTYLQMNRLGCTPAERYLYCYLASRTVDDRTGAPALDRARDSAAQPLRTVRDP